MHACMLASAGSVRPSVRPSVCPSPSSGVTSHISSPGWHCPEVNSCIGSNHARNEKFNNPLQKSSETELVEMTRRVNYSKHPGVASSRSCSKASRTFMPETAEASGGIVQKVWPRLTTLRVASTKWRPGRTDLHTNYTKVEASPL